MKEKLESALTVHRENTMKPTAETYEHYTAAQQAACLAQTMLFFGYWFAASIQADRARELQCKVRWEAA